MHSFTGLIIYCCLAILSAASTSPTVEDGTVLYVGTVSNGTEAFLNIRFGQDTGGEKRFQRPLPYSYPAGTIVDATASGAACPQVLGNPIPEFTGIVGNVTVISEDCLTLRVSRPLGTEPNAKLPVMVYLFGGGYSFGSIYDNIAYDPTGLVKQNALKDLPIIYVAINYRSGFFGFAASDALRSEDNLNSGLLDQYLGLEWIQDHIESFGGNPDDVTIFGEDVGWTNVQLQLTAYGGNTKSLFNKAILQSGPTPNGMGLTSGLSDNHTAQLIETLNCTSTSGDAELACLRSLPLSVINAAAITFGLAFSPLGGTGTFRPTAPSSFIPDVPANLLSSGRYRKDVEIIIGWNENDGTIWVPSTINSTAYFTAVIETLYPQLSASNIETLSNLYPEEDFSDYPLDGIERNFFRAAQVVRDANFACPSLRLAKAFSPWSTYVYTLNESIFTLGHISFNRTFVGIDHFSDQPYVFDYVSKAPYSSVASQADYDLASYTSGSWAAFATYGQPTVYPNVNKTYSDWEPIGSGYQLRVLGGPGDGMVSIPSTYDEDILARCDFWGQLDVILG